MRQLYFLLLICSMLIQCAHKPTNQTLSNLQNKKNQIPKGINKEVTKLEKDNEYLKIQNAMLYEALQKLRSQVFELKMSKKTGTVPFKDFEKLIYEQAQSALIKQDADALKQAAQILEANSPSSDYLGAVYYLQSRLYFQNGRAGKAIRLCNKVLDEFPRSFIAPSTLYLKAKIYQKMNLKAQALKLYKNLGKVYPGSKETKLSKVRIMELNKQ